MEPATHVVKVEKNAATPKKRTVETETKAEAEAARLASTPRAVCFLIRLLFVVLIPRSTPNTKKHTRVSLNLKLIYFYLNEGEALV